MADTLKLEIVTPAAVTYSEDVYMVTLPTADGQIGVYPHHIPLMTRIEPGEIIVRKKDSDDFIAIGAGLVEITGDHVVHRHGHGRGGQGHRHGQGGRSAAAGASPPARQDLGRGGRDRQRLARPVARAAESEEAAGDLARRVGAALGSTGGGRDPHPNAGAALGAPLAPPGS